MLRLFAITSVFILVSGCGGLSSVVGIAKNVSTVSTIHTIATISDDRRSFGQIFDDGVIGLKVSNSIQDTLNGMGVFDVNSRIYNNKLLLTGDVSSEKIKSDIEKNLWEIRHVNSIENELVVGRDYSAFNLAFDSTITLDIKTSLLNSDDSIFNQVDIHTHYGVVYVLGRLTKYELDKVIDASISSHSINGLRYFVINEDNPSQTLTADSYRKFYF